MVERKKDKLIMFVKKSLKVLFVCVFFVVMFSGCRKTETSVVNSQKIKAPIVLKYAHTDTENSITGRQAQLFADKVNKACEGRVKIEIYPLGQLGTSSELVSGVQTGTIDMTFLTMAMIGNICDEFSVLDTPYLFNSIEQCVAVCDPNSKTMRYLSDKLYKATNVKYLFSFYFGTRETTANKPIYSPSDMKGLKFRSMNFPFYLSYYQALGAVPTPIDITELAQALQTGEIEGQENPVDVIIARQMYENQKYLIMTNHMICSQGVVMNGKKWDSITDVDKALIMKAADETVAESYSYVMNLTELETDQLVNKYGMTLIDKSNGLNIDAFKSIVDGYIKKTYAEKYSTVYKLIEQDKLNHEK